MVNPINTKTYTDIKRLAWIERFIPESFRVYAYLMRLDRPVGIWLLLLPSLWGITMALGSAQNNSQNIDIHALYIISLFTLGAIIMRGAGCVINDIWDRDIDKQVERTRYRPIASGEICVKKALIFLATLLLIAFIILLQFNITTVILGIITLPMIISYPLMKRITWWPQLFLGLTFNFGVLMGFSAIAEKIELSPILLYIGAIFWTVGYDTIYAHQDKDDDSLIGVKSTALKFGDNSKLWVAGFYALSFILISVAILTDKQTTTPLIITLSILALHFAWQMKSWNPYNKESSLKIFRSNRDAGLIILLICML